MCDNYSVGKITQKKIKIYLYSFFYSPIALGYSFLRYKMVVCVGVGVGGK